MLIAVGETGAWSKSWQSSLLRRGVEPLLVDPVSNDIMHQLRGADALLWHWDHGDHAAWRVARGIFAACKESGILTIPDAGSAQHFDDKVAQKYVLEDWVAGAEFPKVWKLRRGAGSLAVRMVKDRKEAKAVVQRAFGRGFRPTASPLADAATKLRKAPGWSAIAGKTFRIPQTLAAHRLARATEDVERGYVYFQDFISGNTCDIRVTVIGERAFTFRRTNRPGDFRASGSGAIQYCSDPAGVDRRAVEIAFQMAGRLQSPSMAFDFLASPTGEPLVVEMSYAYQADAVAACPGHFDRNMVWSDGHVRPEDAMVDDLLGALGRDSSCGHSLGRG